MITTESNSARSERIKSRAETYPLTRDVEETFTALVSDDPDLVKAFLCEAISLFATGEPEVARLALRDVVNYTVGFERLSVEVNKPSKSLHRMLSLKGNPTMDNLSAIVNALRKALNINSLEVSTAPPDDSEAAKQLHSA